MGGSIWRRVGWVGGLGFIEAIKYWAQQEFWFNHKAIGVSEVF